MDTNNLVVYAVKTVNNAVFRIIGFNDRKEPSINNKAATLSILAGFLVQYNRFMGDAPLAETLTKVGTTFHPIDEIDIYLAAGAGQGIISNYSLAKVSTSDFPKLNDLTSEQYCSIVQNFDWPQ